MKHTFKILWLFIRSAIRTSFQHRMGIFFFTLGKAIRFGTFFFFIYHLVVNTTLLAGYDLNQTIIFFLTFNIVDSTAQLLFREVYRFRQLVVSGELDTVLVKPYHPFLRILLGGIDVLDLFMLVPFILLLMYFSVQLAVPFVNVVSYVALLVNALVVSAGFHIAVLGFTIFTMDVDHTIMIYRDVTRLGMFSIDIYREPIRSIFTFVVPVGIMMSFPVKALLGVLAPQFIIMSFVFGAGVLFISIQFWNRALMSYQSGRN